MENHALVSPSPDAQRIHEELVASCREGKVIEHRVAILLARLHQQGLHRELGFVSVHEYAERRLDITPRQSREMVHIGRMLPEFPQVDAAFAEGRIGWTKAREILRVATPETEEAWVERAATVTSRVLEDQVARSVRGDPPPGSDDRRRAPERRRVTFEMSSADANSLFAALEMLRQQSEVSRHDVDDGMLLAALAARVLHEAHDTTAPSAERYRILIEQCPQCGRTEGADATLAESVLSEAQCDAELVDLRPGSTHGHASRTIPPAIRRAVLGRDRYQCTVPGCTNRLWLDIHHLVHRKHGGAHTLANLIAICTVHHRMVHDGQMDIRWNGDVLTFLFPDGRIESVRRPRHDPRGSPSAPGGPDLLDEVVSTTEGGGGGAAPP